MEPILCFITIHCNLIFVGIDTFYYLSPFVSSKSSKSDSNWKYFSFLQQPSLLQGQSLNVHTKFLQLLSTWKSWHWRESGMCDWFKICRAFCRAFLCRVSSLTTGKTLCIKFLFKIAIVFLRKSRKMKNRWLKTKSMGRSRAKHQLDCLSKGKILKL